MRLSVFSDTDWLYPDSAHNSQRSVNLEAVCGGHSGAQILGDVLKSNALVDFQWNSSCGPDVHLFQMLPVGVNENTSPTLMTTTDYESCRSFVTRKAPFDVYDALRPVCDALPANSRLALYLCVEVPEKFSPGKYEGTLSIKMEENTVYVPLFCTVHDLHIPRLSDASLGMLNFFDYDGLATQHQVEKNSSEYWELFRQYVRAQIQMRCTHILLPAGEAVKQNGIVTGFDFSAAERAGQIACEEGAVKLCGGHIAHWHAWDDSEYYPNWDQTIGITTPQGYLQMRLYFSQWAEVIKRNHWEDCMTQALADEPQTHNDRTYRMERLRKFIAEHPYVNVIRYTTFFHQFTLVFDELKREKYVDWYGYSASVSPYILEQFEKEVGYKFRPEFIVDQGYHNNQYRVPSKEFKDFQAFQRREVAALAKEMVDITHELGKEAMMFLGDHWIGTEPFMEEWKTIGVDAVVGSVGNGSTLRLISDIPGVKYTEGRFLPYFFPDTFHEGGNPVKEAKENWVTARRAILRKPVDRIGYGGYLKLALQFPEFIDYVESVCNEFRELYENVKGTTPYCVKTVAVLNSWGKMRAWGCHMVHHALYQKQNYFYAGIIEALSGAPFDVKFISFDDIRKDPAILDSIDVVINVGDGDTAHTGGAEWEDAVISSAIRKFVHNGGGFIGVGEPSGHQYQGHYLQLAKVLGVEKETGFTLNYDKYNWETNPDHFILADVAGEVDFGEGKKSIYAFEGTDILVQKDKEVQMAANSFGNGRSVYISGLPYSFENSRVLYRAILWAANSEEILNKWFSTNYNVEVHAFVANSKYCVVNNTYVPQDTTVYTDTGSFDLHLEANEIRWYSL